MNDELTEFVRRVEAFEIDPGDKTLRFVDRLARENRWTIAFATRVVQEYKRFCILAMRAGHPVTPSEQVDQAWHLHLTYTRSYWQRFCQETLGEPLHHEPTEGGTSEGAKFRDWYAETLKSYQRVFGCEPPSDIWPVGSTRFAHAGAWQWVNVGRCWTIPKRRGYVALGVVGLLTVLGLAGCQIQFGSIERATQSDEIIPVFFPFTLGGTAFLWFYAVLCAIALVIVFIMRFLAGRSEASVGDQKFDDAKLNIDELAVLAGGGSRLAHVALTRLYLSDQIAVEKGFLGGSKCKVKGSSDFQKGSSLDRDLFHAIREKTHPSRLVASVKPHYERIEQSLIERGLRRKTRISNVFAVVPIAGVFAIGVARLIQGILAGEEFGYLVLMMFVFAVIALLIAIENRGATAKGKQQIERVKSQIDSQRDSSIGQTNEVLALSVAVLGASSIKEIDGLLPLSSLMSNVGNSSSGGGGCGAGCGGGGCGGCGGCGG